mmetsp:Transcript_59096/g.159166  ORF Transcript_59096/g.159166 Transcript_59096/m.159166 type:complete len:241 (+) Transcript_59096:58-780(+)
MGPQPLVSERTAALAMGVARLASQPRRGVFSRTRTQPYVMAAARTCYAPAELARSSCHHARTFPRTFVTVRARSLSPTCKSDPSQERPLVRGFRGPKSGRASPCSGDTRGPHPKSLRRRDAFVRRRIVLFAVGDLPGEEPPVRLAGQAVLAEAHQSGRQARPPVPDVRRRDLVPLVNHHHREAIADQVVVGAVRAAPGYGDCEHPQRLGLLGSLHAAAVGRHQKLELGERAPPFHGLDGV